MLKQKSILPTHLALPGEVYKSLWLSLISLALAQSLTLHAQPSATNQVLELDGNGSYVQLPPGIFKELTESTVEGWVKWDSFRRWSRFFDFGATWNGMSLTHLETTSDLLFQLFAPDHSGHNIRVPGILQTNRWCHIAAVTGPGGMKLYLNGHLIGSDRFTGSFAAIQRHEEAFFGHSTWHYPTLTPDADFHGQMDEIRVWKVARTGTQIRETMFQRLTGAESDLAALWNFENVENGVVKDSGPRGYHGKLVGNSLETQRLFRPNCRSPSPLAQARACAACSTWMARMPASNSRRNFSRTTW
jgi:hypothetical protein